MSSERHYKANLRDTLFNLFEFWRIQDDTLGHGPFANVDQDTSVEILSTFEKFCTEEMATSFTASDRIPLKLDDEGNVTLPEALRKSIETYYDNEWHRMEHPESLGGYGAPRSLMWSCFEFLAGANPPIAFYLLGNFEASVINELGTESQKARFVDGLVNKRWGGTMVLTEPDAGSDVGAGRTKAKHIEGEVWEIEGVKRFITNGDYDAAENIVHMVLARPEGAGPGTKGLSLFLVPKFWVEEDGTFGERNGAYCTNLEDKMGLKGSATCEMTFGEKQPCRGLLLGDKHDGIRQMFNVIEYARMAVGVKSIATLTTAYLNSLEYTKERVQGADLARAADKSAPKVTIINHPDVRRSLIQQKAYAEGLRALATFASTTQDKIRLAEASGDADKAKSLHRLNDLLLPLVKGFSSERVYELLASSLQCLGGSGYCRDYPHEQYIRDQKIDSLYEGTTAIQGLDLIFRKILRDNGATLQIIMGKVQETASREPEDDVLADERKALGKALMSFGGIIQVMTGKLTESIYFVGLHSTRILFALSELTIGWLLVEHAELAAAKMEGASSDDAFYYQGKIASARYFCAEELPRVGMAHKVIKDSTLHLMELPEEAF